MAGTTEICGDTTSNNSVLELEGNSFTVKFRSSEETKGEGFEMYVICFEKAERDMEGMCITFHCSKCFQR